MELDEAFASKDDIATAVLESLAPVMKEYGKCNCISGVFLDETHAFLTEYFVIHRFCSCGDGTLL
jgi:hypothetical protein